MDTKKLAAIQHLYFDTGKTRSLTFRLHALERLKNGIKRMENDILQALKEDLGKSPTEGYMTEIGMVLSEISHMEKYLRFYAAKKYVWTPVAQFCSVSYKVPEPYGVVLVMSPWNYPFMLTMAPVIDAIAAGNTAVIKPSAYAPATSAVIAKLVSKCFRPEYLAVVQGGRDVNQDLLEQKFDYIFFTGGKTVGRLVMEKASAHLTPVTLELGGKSPCIVDATADLKLAAKRIVFGKFLNLGQTCVAPDYLLVHHEVKKKLIKYICREIKAQLGSEPMNHPEYGRIVNEKHFKRLLGLLENQKIIVGGESDARQLKIAPTVVDGVTLDNPLMGEEIFGPILPVMTYRTREEARKIIQANATPLALYLFTNSRKSREYFTKNIRFGGGCINDTIIHLATSHMGFGGTGESGMGSYHGKAGFETFSHYKSIVDKKNWIDLPMRYHPYSSLKDCMIRLFLK